MNQWFFGEPENLWHSSDIAAKIPLRNIYLRVNGCLDVLNLDLIQE